MRLVDSRAEEEEERPASGPEVLLAGWPAAAAEVLIAALRRRGIAARLVATAALTCDGVAVVALGPELTQDEVNRLLETIPDGAVVVAIANGEPSDRLYFAAPRPLPVEETTELLHAAWRRAGRPPADAADDDGRLLDLLRRLTRETELWPAARAVASEARVLCDAAQAHVWIVDGDDAALVAEERRQSAAAGLTGYVARTGRGVAVGRLGDDPRHDAERDGDAEERFLAWPLVFEERVFEERVLGVLTLRRPPHAPPFADAEQEQVARMTRLLAPVLARLVLDRELERRAAERHAAIREDVARIYRGEALEQYQRGRADEAHLLEIEPRWTRHAYRVLLALLLAALLFSALVQVDRSAEGWGVVRDGRLIAVLAARHRPELRPGQPLRFEHAGTPLTVTAVQRRIIAAGDARRLLGPDGPRLWTTTGPAVAVEATLPHGEYGQGVTGRVRVQLGRERLLFAWVRRG